MKITVFIIFSLLLSTISIYTQTWEFVGLDSMVIKHLYVSGDSIWAGTAHRVGNQDRSGLYRSVDGGNNWVQIDNAIGNGVILGFELIPPSTLFIIKGSCAYCVAGTLYKSTNNGETWEVIDNISNYPIRWFGISPFNNNNIYSLDWLAFPLGMINFLYKSIDGGENWYGIGSFPGSSHGSRLTFAFDLIDSMSLYVTVNTQFDQYLYKSTDKGNNWFFVSTPPVAPAETRTDLFLPGRIYLFAQYKATSDGGFNWYDFDSGLPNQQNYLSFYMNANYPNKLFNLRRDGLYVTKNDSINWILMQGTENLPLNIGSGGFNFDDVGQMTNLIINPDKDIIYIGTAKGLYKKNLATSIDDNMVTKPSEYLLYQNYPNPFNPSTTISYLIPERSFIKISVYNILGKEVRTLIEEQQTAGQFELEFESIDLPSGVYLYVLTATTETGLQVKEGKKMLLIK